MTIKLKKEFDVETSRSLASAVLMNPDDGEKMREDILKIRDTIFKITVGSDSDSNSDSLEGPVMLSPLSVRENGGRLRLRGTAAARVKQNDSVVKASARYAEPYNVVPRVVGDQEDGK